MTEPALPQPDRSSAGFPFLTLLVAGLGLGLLVLSVRQAGWGQIAASFRSLGAWFGVIVALGAVRMAIRARAWSLCSRAGAGAGIPFRDAFVAVIAADAVGNLTPFGLLASEPAKVMMARRHVSTVTSLSSVTVENVFYSLSVIGMLLGGTWVLLQRAMVPAALQRIGEGVLAASIAGLVVGLWVFRTRPAVLTRLSRLVARFRPQANESHDAAAALEAQVYGVVRWPARRLATVAAWEVLFHVAAVAEVWLVLRALPGGGATTIVDAFLMEAAGRFITVAFKFIPYRLGVDEIGSGSVSQLIGLGTPAGVTLALVRRARILILNAVGIGLFSVRS